MKTGQRLLFITNMLLSLFCCIFITMSMEYACYLTPRKTWSVLPIAFCVVTMDTALHYFV